MMFILFGKLGARSRACIAVYEGHRSQSFPKNAELQATEKGSNERPTVMMK